MLRTIFAACSVVVLAGCTALGDIALRDRRDAPWDPPPGRALFEQIPAWDGAAHQICGGHLHPDEARRRGMTQRC